MAIDRNRLTIFQLNRWISAIVFVCVFALPLHFHAVSALTSQVTKQCSCLHGTRTQLGLVGVAIQSAPLVHVDLQPSLGPQHFSQISPDLATIRAPPIL
jgi:hypothetical protein